MSLLKQSNLTGPGAPRWLADPVDPLIQNLSTHAANQPLSWGATLLVDLSTATSYVVPLDAVGATIVGHVPNHPSLSGASVYLQALERDDAVPHRHSVTPGLELHFGR